MIRIRYEDFKVPHREVIKFILEKELEECSRYTESLNLEYAIKVYDAYSYFMGNVKDKKGYPKNIKKELDDKD